MTTPLTCIHRIGALDTFQDHRAALERQLVGGNGAFSRYEMTNGICLGVWARQGGYNSSGSLAIHGVGFGLVSPISHPCMRCFRQDRSIVGMGSEQIERVALGLRLHYLHATPHFVLKIT